MTTDLHDNLAEELDAYAEDPLGFVENMFPWGQGELQGAQIGDWQRNLLDDLGKKLRAGYVKQDGLWQYVGGAVRKAIASGHGIGKAHPLDMQVPTPGGIRRWGDLKKGDTVFSADGKPTRIRQTRRYEKIPMYRVTFDDRSYCDVSSGHLWNVRGRQERREGIPGWRTLGTMDLIRLGVKRKNGVAWALQWEIQTSKAVEFDNRSVGADPYLIGLWLGDGSRRKSAITSNDPDVLDQIRSRGHSHHVGTKAGTSAVSIYLHGLGAELRRIGSFDKHSYNKSVPDDYKINSVEVRSEVLRGLLDTDGEATKSGSIVFSSTSKALAEDVVWLARSLGGKARVCPTTKMPFYRGPSGERLAGRPCHRAVLTMPDGFRSFYIKRKQYRVKNVEHRYLARWIKSIDPIPDADGMCISVAAPDGLYLANDFIVTHNSALVSWLILWALATMQDTMGVVTANTATQLATKTWAQLGKWHRLFLGSHLFIYTATSIYSSDPKHEKTWRVDAIPWTKNRTEAFAGLHNKGKRLILIFDEASAIDNPIWEVSEGALTDENTEIMWFAFGNPTRNSGRFFDCFHKFKKLWDHVQIDSRTVKITNKKQIAEWVESYGEDSDFCRIRIRGVFPRQGDRQFFASELLEKARQRGLGMTPNSIRHMPCVISLDSAWTGGDEIVCGHKRGLFVKVAWVQAKNDDDVVLAQRLAQTEDELGADAVNIDFGYGTGVASVGKHMNRKWALIPFGGESTNQKKWKNKRAEMYDKLRTFMKEGGAIADDPALIDQLSQLEEIYRDDGIIQLEAKDDFIERTGYSPGRADAAALCFALPVKMKSEAERAGIPEGPLKRPRIETSAPKEYDPYADMG